MNPIGSAPPANHAPPSAPRWFQKMSAVVFITFCIELGVFLVVFPWTDYWARNYFAGLAPAIGRVWNNYYLRGALNGLGMVNLYISAVEIIRLLQYGRR